MTITIAAGSCVWLLVIYILVFLLGSVLGSLVTLMVYNHKRKRNMEEVVYADP